MLVSSSPNRSLHWILYQTQQVQWSRYLKQCSEAGITAIVAATKSRLGFCPKPAQPITQHRDFASVIPAPTRRYLPSELTQRDFPKYCIPLYTRVYNTKMFAVFWPSFWVGFRVITHVSYHRFRTGRSTCRSNITKWVDASPPSLVLLATLQCEWCTTRIC
jgi:hypothetical protein